MAITSLIAVVGWIILLPFLFMLGGVVAPIVKKEGGVIRGVIYIAFAYGVFGYFIVFIGSLGFLGPYPILIFVGLIYALRFRKIPDFLVWLQAISTLMTSVKGKWSRISTILFLSTLAVTFLMCLTPEVANDALCYQLNIPKMFVWNHSTLPLYYDLNSFMPLLMNHLYSVGIIFKSIAISKIFHWLAGALLVVSFIDFTRQQTGGKEVSLYLGLLLLLTPTLINESSTTYVDLAVSLFVFLGFVLLQRGVEDERLSMVALSGVFFGLAVSSKLLMLIAVAGAGTLLLLNLLIRGKVGALKGLLAFGAATALAGGFWFLRNYILYENPLYPYMGRLFGTESFGFMSSYANLGAPKTLLNFVLLPWNLTFDPVTYDAGHWWGFIYLLVLPLFFLGLIKEKRARPAALFVIVFSVAWFFLAQNVRFLLPAFPIYLVVSSFGFALLVNVKPIDRIKEFTRIVTVLMAVGFFALTGYHYRAHYYPLLGIWDQHTYLSNMERSYSISTWISEHLPMDAKILNVEEVRQFYFNRLTVREHWFQLREGYDDDFNGEALLRLARERGFTHILRADYSGRENTKPQWTALDQILETTSDVKTLIVMESKNTRERKFQYSLYEI